MILYKFAIPLVQQFEVIKDDMLPTHSVLRLTMSKAKMQTEKTFIKTLPSLKKMFDNKVSKLSEGKSEKEARIIEEEETKKLQNAMDQRLEMVGDFLDTYNQNGDMDNFYKTLSAAIEKGRLTYQDEGKEFDRAAKGRGKVTLITTKVNKTQSC